MVLAEERRLVDVAAAVLTDEEQRLGISYAGFALTGVTP
jgi:hypothetical protein